MSDSRQAARAAIFSLLLGVVPFSVMAAGGGREHARDWLEDMTGAVDSLNYEGVYIHQHGDDLETMRIVHVVAEGREREHLVSLNGPAREVIRDNDEVTCYLPDKKAVMVDRSPASKPFPARLPDDLSRLEASYALEVMGDERVAGQPARVVEIRARDRFRYGYRLWLHAEHALPLRSSLLDERGQVVEQVMFTDFSLIDDPSRADLQPSVQAEGFAWHHSEEKIQELGRQAADPAAWQAGWLPPGFALTHDTRHPMPEDMPEVDHMVFSDGLASVSVYIENAAEDRKQLRGKSRMGAVNAFGTRIGVHQVTVVGEVPVETVKRIAESVRRDASRD